jgi:hypothetical protein
MSAQLAGSATSASMRWWLKMDSGGGSVGFSANSTGQTKRGKLLNGGIDFHVICLYDTKVHTK